MAGFRAGLDPTAGSASARWATQHRRLALAVSNGFRRDHGQVTRYSITCEVGVLERLVRPSVRTPRSRHRRPYLLHARPARTSCGVRTADRSIGPEAIFGGWPRPDRPDALTRSQTSKHRPHRSGAVLGSQAELPPGAGGPSGRLPARAAGRPRRRVDRWPPRRGRPGRSLGGSCPAPCSREVGGMIRDGVGAARHFGRKHVATVASRLDRAGVLPSPPRRPNLGTELSVGRGAAAAAAAQPVGRRQAPGPRRLSAPLRGPALRHRTCRDLGSGHGRGGARWAATSRSAMPGSPRPPCAAGCP